MAAKVTSAKKMMAQQLMKMMAQRLVKTKA